MGCSATTRRPTSSSARLTITDPDPEKRHLHQRLCQRRSEPVLPELRPRHHQLRQPDDLRPERSGRSGHGRPVVILHSDAGELRRAGPVWPRQHLLRSAGLFLTASSAGCPAQLQAEFAAAGEPSPCGYNAEGNSTHSDAYGIQPRLTVTPPTLFGIVNTIKVGGLVAKERQPASHGYASVFPNVPELSQNEIWSTIIGSTGGFDGGFQRTIYQGYLQDKIDFVGNTLHVTPGRTVEETDLADLGSKIFEGTPSASLLATP